MDFMRLLKSLEELLYELASWLLFYPLTMWRTLRRPTAMMRYADVELADTQAEQYTDTLSPPLFLLITLLLAHGIELSLRDAAPWVLPAILASDSNLLIFRGVAFSIFPLLMSLKMLRHRGIRLDRHTLKPPFYSQCYVAAPFAFSFSLLGSLSRMHNPTVVASGMVIFAISLIWYVVIETRWFASHLKLSTGRAAFMVIVTVCQAILIMFLAGAAIVYGLGSGITR